ncbi:LIC10647 family lipoprotein [Leptospira yasudae]|uniref:LIC10647 family lipoprotein n=1 Tax=Leptospira yasudae TaxID=2202201 RepID=UPI001FC928FE|nr:hypothetical protein [Leptospira yasudae]
MDFIRSKRKRILCKRWIFLLLAGFCLGFLSSCKTLESFFETIILTGGVDSTQLNFFAKYNPLEEWVRSNGGLKVPERDVRPVNHDPPKSVPFYTIGSIPRRLPGAPYSGYFAILNYFAYGFTVTSPRTFRGDLLNFPDDGRTSSNLLEQTFFGLYPLPDPFGRKAEYLYMDYQAYATFYLGFIASQNWNLGIGVNLGYSVYDFDILEKGYRVSTARNQTRAITGFKLLYEYNIGRFFEDTIFYNVYLYLEASTIGNIANNDHDSFNLGNFGKTPITQTIPASNAEGYHDLYLTMSTLRIGVRKEIQLSRPTADDLLRKNSEPPKESAPPKETQPVPPRI